MSYNLNQIQGGNVALAKGGLSALSGAATTFNTTATINYTINGAFQTAKTAVTGGATPTTDANTGVTYKGMVASQACAFVWCLDSSGAVKVAQGRVVSYVDTSAKSTVCPLPTIPDTLTPFAYVVIKAGATTVGTWTFGASNWNATGITVDSAVDIMVLPPTDPQTA